MKRPISPAYTFTPGSSTLNLSGIAGFAITNLFAVIDLKVGALIYAPLPGYGYSALSGTTLTLQASMAGLASNDPLLILYDDGGKPAEDASVQAVVTALGVNHADLVALHTDIATGNHADLVAIAAKLPTGPALDATLQSILTALQAQRAESLWTDDTNAYFVRVDRAGTITWTDLSGNATAAPGAGARPAAGTTVLLDRSAFQATGAATGYSIGDFLDHFITTDPTSGVVIGNFWINASTGLKLASAPAAGNITPVAPLPSGAALDATLQAILAKQPGSPALDGSEITGAAIPAGGSGIRGWLSAIWTVLKGGAPNAAPIDMSGTLLANGDTVAIVCSAMNTGVIGLPTIAGSCVVEGTLIGDYSDVRPLSVIPYGGGASVSTLTAADIYEVTITGLKGFRVRATSPITNGPITVLLRAATGNKSIRVGAGPQSPNLSLSTVPANPSTTNTKRISMTGSPIQLSAVVGVVSLVNGVTCFNRTGNPSPIYTGGSSAAVTAIDGTGDGKQIVPGAAGSSGISSTSALWLNGANGVVVDVEYN